MSTETPQLGLPLLEAAQAQKHVTVNEALARLDALASPVVAGPPANTPPAAPQEGELWAVGAAPVGAWSGRAGRLALFSGLGWSFIAPRKGQRVHDGVAGGALVFDGAHWVASTGEVANGAATALRVASIDHAIAAGASSTTAAMIPDKAIVLGVTGRVLTSIPGATAWRLGVPGAASRYGASYGVAAGSFAAGVTGQPQAYFAPTPLLIEAQGANFLAGGMVRLCVHFLALTPPTAL